MNQEARKVVIRGRGGRPLSILPILVAALTLSGCGLETVEYISAPQFYNGSGFLVLKDTASTGSNPRDFEILYRIYESQSDATSALNNINGLVASSSSSPVSVRQLLMSGSLSLRPMLFSFTDPNVDPSILQLKLNEEGVNSYFQIGTPNSANWTVEKFVGSSSGVFADVGPIASTIYRNTFRVSSKPIYDVTQINDSQNDIDYKPDSTIIDPSVQALQYPPPANKAYLVLCAVEKSTSDFINYTYSMPTPLANGTCILQIPDGTQLTTQ